VGFDDMQQTLDDIRSGIVTATIVQKQYLMGYEGIMTLLKIREGHPPAQKVIDTGVTVVTKDNVDSYMK
jgi:ribose transport system substrate-binding protein